MPSARLAALVATERRVLELVARGRPLAEALGELTRSIERVVPGMLASVLRLDAEGRHLHHGATSSLPEDYRAVIDGAEIGPEAGSCGSAAHRKELVVSTDIATDPRWVPWREAALRNGLRACWSAPILGASGDVLGTFALYYRAVRAPDPEHVALIEAAANVAAVAIERHRMDEERTAMIADLSRAVRFAEMFVAVLGHDLRNPLAAIMTSASLLTRDTGEGALERNAERILESSERMERMIAQLLDVTRIRVGSGIPLDRREADLLDLCRYVVEEIGGGDRRARTLFVDHAGDARGTWDRDRLLQVISNLVGNAAEHAAPHAPIVVHVDGTDADVVVLTVINAGEIPEALAAVVFDPLRRGFGDRSGRRGLGLGLFISQQIVLAHGGTIAVASASGTTTFTVTLPRGDRSPTTAPPVVTFDAAAAAPSVAAARATVVVVEDEPALRDALAELLTAEGYAVATDATGAGAIDVIRSIEGPRVVVLDMTLPARGGDDIYREMRADPELSRVPVIVATGDVQKAPPGVPLFRKPVEPAVLLAAIRTLLA